MTHQVIDFAGDFKPLTRRAERMAHAHRRKPQRRIDWVAVALLGAAALVAFSLLYKLTGPSL